MENKYYTPNIEEFHVGFEYERLYQNDDILYQWDKEEMSVNFLTLDDIDNEILNEEIRVKFLDKEDIESLGWVEEPVNSKFHDVYHLKCKIYKKICNGIYLLIVDEYSNKILIKSPNMLRDGSGNFNGYTTIVNKINIKNISELKVLLKQLGINE